MGTCKYCKYGHFQYPGDSGQCRRHAPTAKEVPHHVSLDLYIPVWPIMQGHQWCGDWEAKEIKDEKL